MVTGEEGQGDLLRVAGAEDDREDAASGLVPEPVQVGQGQLARLDLFLGVGGPGLTQARLECVAGDEESRELRAGGCWPGCMTTPAASSSMRAWSVPAWSIGT